MKITVKASKTEQRKLEPLTLFKAWLGQEDALYLKTPGGAVDIFGGGYFPDDEYGDDECVAVGRLEVEV